MTRTTKYFMGLVDAKMKPGTQKETKGKKLPTFPATVVVLMVAAVMSVVRMFYMDKPFGWVYAIVEAACFAFVFIINIREEKDDPLGSIPYLEYQKRLAEMLDESTVDIIKIAVELKADLQSKIDKKESSVSKVIKMSGTLCSMFVIAPVSFLLKDTVSGTMTLSTVLDLINIFICLAIIIIIIVILGYMIKSRISGKEKYGYYISILDDIIMVDKAKKKQISPIKRPNPNRNCTSLSSVSHL